jgi:hypothetical protein
LIAGHRALHLLDPRAAGADLEARSGAALIALGARLHRHRRVAVADLDRAAADGGAAPFQRAKREDGDRCERQYRER